MTLPEPKIDLKTSKMMVVDDSGPSLDIIKQILMGFRVRDSQAYQSAAEATPSLAKVHFDLIILDVEMPGEDGIMLTERIRRGFEGPNAETPIILVSGAPSREVMMAGRDAGANIAIRKPVTPALLLSRITWLAKSAREFVRSESYCGPDRRFKRGGPPAGVLERRAGELALMAHADRELAQSEIDNLFN